MPEALKPKNLELISMTYYQLKLESCYLQSGSIKGDFKAVKDSADRIIKLVKQLEKELTT